MFMSFEIHDTYNVYILCAPDILKWLCKTRGTLINYELCDSIIVVRVHGKRGFATLSPDNAIECVVHGCDVLNKRGFACPYVLSEHTHIHGKLILLLSGCLL